MLARIFSSNIKAAMVNSKNPMAIDQNVSETLDMFFETFLVAMIEIARLRAEAKVKNDPYTKSVLKFTDKLLVDVISMEPPAIPKPRARYLIFDNLSLRMILPRKSTARGEVSIMAAERLEGMNLSPASCIG